MYAYFLILNGLAICGSGAQGRWGISNTFNLFDKHGGGHNTSSATRPFALLSPSHFSARKAPPSRQLARKPAWVTPARQRGLPGCVCADRRVCVNIDVPYEQLCHYIILTLFISSGFFRFDPQFVKDTGFVFQRRASEWFVFWYGSPLPPHLLSFSKSCDPVISRHVCDEIGPLKILKASVELADFQGRSGGVGTEKAERVI